MTFDKQWHSGSWMSFLDAACTLNSFLIKILMLSPVNVG